MTSELMFSWLGQLVAAGGGGALVAYGLFRYLGKGWIETQFAKDLEAAKSELSLLAARKMKLHDREYIVFPEVWAKLNKAFSSLYNALGAFREFPAFNRMSGSDLQNWTEHSGLSDSEKIYFEREADKAEAYGRILDWRSLREAKKDFVDFHTYLQANRIFLNPEIKKKLDDIASLLLQIWAAKKMDGDGYSLVGGRSYLSEAVKKYDEEAKPIKDEIEILVQKRIFPESHAGEGR